MRTLGICQLRFAPAAAHLCLLALPTYAPTCTAAFSTASSKSQSRGSLMPWSLELGTRKAPRHT